MRSSKSFSLLMLFSLLLLLILDPAALTSLDHCKNYCGEVEIPYPFGIGKGCYLDKGYKIECKTVSGEELEIPFLSIHGKQVVKISLPSRYLNSSMSHASLHIRSPVTNSSNKQEFGSLLNSTGQRNSQWSHAKQYATLELEWSFRTSDLTLITSLGCQNMLQDTGLSSHNINCICQNRTDFGIMYASCGCTKGYRGNPYLLGGCKDINECKEYTSEGDRKYCEESSCVNFQGGYRCTISHGLSSLTLAGKLLIVVGVLMVVGVGVWLFIFIRRRKRINRKKNFFKRNGGLLLQQQLTSTEGTVESTKVFTSKELKKATENFNENRVLGQGGQGTVYKGMLVDGRIVAVKKSKIVDEDKLEEFINEVVILSHINHRNIVKLLGCCLETEVPLLVYEFIPNGNLFEHLHDESGDHYTMATWEVRLRMAIEIAGALSYLHSAASSPIYHRDIKSTNIMLDAKYRAKVSDFGTSRTVTEDHTHLTTLVSGTAGYLDPEYFQSSQFTDKSDVYSFGVVLVELITGEKPISFTRPQENRTLATYFNLSMKKNKVADIIDARIRDDCKLEQVIAVAQVARRCLNLKRMKRPNMRQVVMELEMIRSSPEDMQAHVYVSENEEEEEKEEGAMGVNRGVESRNNVFVTAPASQYNVAASSSSWSDVEPLFPSQTR